MAAFTQYPVTQGFGPSDEPLDSGYDGYKSFNKGVDLGTPAGTAVDAAVGGTVLAVGDQGDGWGISVKVRDAQGNTHNYGHLSDTKVKVGQQIAPGFILGASGNTGKSTGPHLSYDVMDANGRWIDPTPFLNQQPAPVIQSGSIKMGNQPMAPTPQTGTGTQVVTGKEINLLAAYLQNLANTDQRAYSALSGYLNGAPTLPREMLWQTQQQADRQFSLDVASSGLQKAQFNYTQRMGEAQTRIQEQTLLASQRGPKNAIAYNYLLNDMAAPAGQERAPSGSSGISQPYSDAPQGGGVRAPQGGGGGTNPNLASDMARANQMAAAYNSGDIAGYRASGGTANDTSTNPPAITMGSSTPPATAENTAFNAQQSAASAGQSPAVQAAYDAAFGAGGSWGVPQAADGGTFMSGPQGQVSGLAAQMSWLPRMAEGGVSAPGGYELGQYLSQMRAAGREQEALGVLSRNGYSPTPQAQPQQAAPQQAPQQQAAPPNYNVPSPPNYNVPSPPNYNVPSPPNYNVPSPPNYNVPTPPGYGAQAFEFDDPAALGMAPPNYNVPAPQQRATYRDARRSPTYQADMDRVQQDALMGMLGMPGMIPGAIGAVTGRNPGAESIASKLGQIGPDTWRSIIPEAGRKIADAIPRRAEGGITMGSPVIVGDPKASAPSTPNIEMAVPMMEGDQHGMAVMPIDKMVQGAESNSPAYTEGYTAMQQGAPDPQRMKADKEYLAGVMAFQAEQAQGGGMEGAPGGMVPPAPMPMAANGGVFSNTWYNPQEIANSPSIQKLAGGMNTTGFGATQLDYTLPGTDTALPAGNRANITSLSRMLPSELGFLEGTVETPREMGGLGLDWADYITQAKRAAPTGTGWSTASKYG